MKGIVSPDAQSSIIEQIWTLICSPVGLLTIEMIVLCVLVDRIEARRGRKDQRKGIDPRRRRR